MLANCVPTAQIRNNVILRILRMVSRAHNANAYPERDNPLCLGDPQSEGQRLSSPHKRLKEGLVHKDSFS
jgi:hypothetical protein